MACLVGLLVASCGAGDGGSGAISTDLTERPVPSLPDGAVEELQIVDVIVGTGDTADVGDRVLVSYVGALAADGTEFDASWDRGSPFEFALGQGRVIPGWDEGVVGMKVDGRRMLTIPAEMAYGETGTPDGSIPPGSDLVFVVDLLSATSLAEEVSAIFADGRSRPEMPIVEGRIAELTSETLIEGDGLVAADGDQLAVHYVGAFPDGSEFDASWNGGPRAFPFVLGQGGVINGWQEGLLGAQPGERRLLKVPAANGYGENGLGPIPPDQDLVFVVDILSVRRPTPEEDQPTPIFPDVAPGQIQLTELRPGSGPGAKLGDSTFVHAALYALSTQEQIESTWTSGFPLPIEVGVVGNIAGFDQALLGMQAGSQRQAIIPPNLAYGAEGAPPSIGPNETIVAIIELVEITD